MNNNNHKYIYYIYVSEENECVCKERFPVVYESDKEIVFVRSKGETKTIQKKDVYTGDVEEFIPTYLKLHGSFFATTSFDDTFDGHEMYIEMNRSKVLMELDKLRNTAVHFKKMYINAKKEYDNHRKKLIKYGLIKDEEDDV